jgi:membrane-bound lytic murein transglycosylase B
VILKFLKNALLFIAISSVCAGAIAEKHRKKPGKAGARPNTVASASTGAASFAYATRPEAMALADDIAQRQSLDRAWVRQAIGQARHLPLVTQLVLPPPAGTAKNWALYRSRFVEPKRIAAGVSFWQANRQLLQRAEQEFGVPPEIVVGVIGVETIYGQQLGNFRVIDALATLAFDFPAQHPRARERSAFFKGELEQLLTFKNQQHPDPLKVRGSFAGAMGLPQFMPSSWRKYAIDFDGDGRVDLFNSKADVIGSVAHYFKTFNWQPGMPTHYPVAFDAEKLDKEALLVPDILPTFSVASFAAKGAVVEPSGQMHPGLLALVELQNGIDPPSYVAGTENFYVITRYNWSSYYAMAVIDLGQAVLKVVQNGAASKP